MKKSSLIGHVTELFELIRPLKHPADSIVQEFFRNRHYLGSKDRRFIAEVIYGILRNYRLLRVYVEEGMKSVEPGVVPSIGLYIAFALRMHHEQREAVLSDTESHWKIFFPKSDVRSFVDTVGGAQLPEAIRLDDAKRIAVMHSFPDSIVESWIKQFGTEETESLCRSLNEPAATVIRVNRLKTTVEECRQALRQEGIETERTKLSPVGLVLTKRINAQSLKSYKEGWFEMQDEGSQLLSLLLQPTPGQTIVDACAGGGGKTLHLAALMNNEGALHLIDIDETRLTNIRPRLTRAGVTIAQLHNANRNTDKIKSLEGTADSVLVDAPCSGTGTFRRNPAAKLAFNEAFVDRITGTQLSVLETYSTLVKPGGRLVYTTCTLLRQENEDIVAEFLKNHPEFKVVSAPDVLGYNRIPIDASTDFMTLLPHKTGTDGFFAAVFSKA